MSGMIQTPYGGHGQSVSRLAPLMPPQAYKTYGMSMPLASHWRKATCEEVSCAAYMHGWVTTLDLSTDLGQKQYAYCKADRTRSFSEQRPELNVVKLVYKPGQRCFRAGDHRAPLDRPARLYVAGGDFRGNPQGIPVRVHTRAEDWVDDFATHQDALKAAIERG